MEKERNEALDAWVKAIGAREAADLLGVTEAAVRHWRNGTRKLSAEQCAKIERATNGALTFRQLRPDLF